MKNCGICKNCLIIEKAKISCLRTANPPFSHADDNTVMIWNSMLQDYPCLDTKEEAERT
jgi:hypothetical protein